MITIHATKKLYTHLPAAALVQPAAIANSIDNPLSGWHANLITLQRCNCVLLVHGVTRFPLFIKGLLKADYAHFDQLFADSLMNTLLKIGASQLQLDNAAALLASCQFDSDCNRSVQGTMNQAARDVECILGYEHLRLDEICSYEIAKWLAHRPCTLKGQKDCIWPDKAMLGLLTNSTTVKNNLVSSSDYLRSSGV